MVESGFVSCCNILHGVCCSVRTAALHCPPGACAAARLTRNTVLSLVRTGHVTWILAPDWSLARWLTDICKVTVVLTHAPGSSPSNNQSGPPATWTSSKALGQIFIVKPLSKSKALSPKVKQSPSKEGKQGFGLGLTIVDFSVKHLDRIQIISGTHSYSFMM